MKIKAGTVLVFDHGEYSDYSFSGPFRVLKDFDQADVAEKFRDDWRSQPREEWNDTPSETDFIAWMNKNGYVEDMPSHQWHIGAYGFNPQIQSEPEDQTP